MKGLPSALIHRRVDEVLSIVNLEQAADRKLPTYSGGMKQRIGIAQALLARTAGSVWSVTVDQATAMQLQANYQVSTMVNQMSGITLRIVSATRPHEAAVEVSPSLEEAYLLATSRQAVQV
jgi:ABC-type methionine transport system ATPase subunit